MLHFFTDRDLGGLSQTKLSRIHNSIFLQRQNINSTNAIADNTTPDLTSVDTSSALGITAPEKAVAKKAIYHDCGSEKSVGQCDSNGLVHTSCGEMVVSWLSRISSKPERLRNSFILHFYQQRSHTEIAYELGISYDNVCKRISLARKEHSTEVEGLFPPKRWGSSYSGYSSAANPRGDR
ncbi:MAG: sigma-70 family RNA polymerase sigma factor [Merismopedia sp. SIO2A8]|nr:sigma-70 family RNA polymerase sigma factor [Symploca sp. SIO2B6]NET51522.1 sigma-70 family RNA polymerase sigma factor [Merismopedia sp. SIO2A8]